jgi:uncharacterized protein (TIGR02145 family)
MKRVNITRRGVACNARIFAAIIAVAITFTFNACGDSSSDDPTPPAVSSSGGGKSSPSGISSGGGGSSSGTETGISSGDGNGTSSGVETSSSSEQEHVHTWGDWAETPATCEAAGTKTRTCTGNNSHTETEEIAKLTWNDWTVKTPATLTATGLEERTCPGGASLPETQLIYPKCKGVEYDPAEKLCDERDEKLYKYVDINGQIWTAENLNYKADGSMCGSTLSGNGALSDANTAACDKYGRLYDWNTAMGGAASSTAEPSGVQGVCPSGWHLPSNAEWQTLINFAGGYETAGTKLKATSGWNAHATYGDGTDDYGFSALPGGNGSSVGNFKDVGISGYWWSASQYMSGTAYSQYMLYDYASVGSNIFGMSGLYSVRCVRD